MRWDRHPEYQGDLARLARDGLSAAQIAEKLGLTKGAVIGRANRTGVRINQQYGGDAEFYSCGHERSRDNAKINKSGGFIVGRQCRICWNAKMRVSYHTRKRKAEAA